MCPASFPESATGAGKPSSTFVSYAQNAEDALLWRALRGVERGFYVDVGANHPEIHSVTHAFYQRGWRGINVEPVQAYYDLLCSARPRDVNLRLAAGAAEGELEFFEIPETGLSTLDRDVAQRHRSSGHRVLATRVAVRPLRELWSEHAPQDVHFLKIDVEGAEAAVLAGADLARQRPWIMVVESRSPLNRSSTHDAWESALIEARYAFAHFDGLNRYYVANERAGLIPRLVTPAPAGQGREYVRAPEALAERDDLPAEARLDTSALKFLGSGGPAPTLAHPVSQLCTAAQVREAEFVRWCAALAQTTMFHRKQWEYAYTLEVLDQAGMLRPGRRGLGLACHAEPLPALMAERGCAIVAIGAPASADPDGSNASAILQRLNSGGICDPVALRERVDVRVSPLNAVAPGLSGFDFVWGNGALGPLGSIANITPFVLDIMQRLKPGGIAVLTVDFNLSSNLSTIEAPGLVLFRRHDIEDLVRLLGRHGHEVARLNLDAGDAPLDRYLDLPPYRAEPHLRLKVDRFAVTSLGLTIRGAR